MALELHGGNIFAVSREHGWNWREVLDFSASINPLGPSPLVKPAICQALDRIVHYPERDPQRLHRALARIWNVPEERIIAGNGATELIFFLARVHQSSAVTLALPVFSEFQRAFRGSGTTDLLAPESWPGEGLLVLTRPANPTGWTLPIETLRRYLENSAASVLVDESFLEFSCCPSAATLIEQYPRLMVLRSLTKFYALPGMRVGALLATESTVRAWKEQREPWQVNVLAEEAALAALSDSDHAAKSIEFVTGERVWLSDQIRSLPNTDPLPSDANFIFIRLTHPAAALSKHLLQSRILIRNCSGWPGVHGEAVRIAVRTRKENEYLLNAWRGFPHPGSAA